MARETKPRTFKPGKSYPIETLPDDLTSDTPASEMWAIKSALFWNDCQGWWIEYIADYWLGARYNGHVARFWQPVPAAPMSREAILAEQGMKVCPVCDVAIASSRKPCAQDCRVRRLG